MYLLCISFTPTPRNPPASVPHPALSLSLSFRHVLLGIVSFIMLRSSLAPPSLLLSVILAWVNMAAKRFWGTEGGLQPIAAALARCAGAEAGQALFPLGAVRTVCLSRDQRITHPSRSHISKGKMTPTDMKTSLDRTLDFINMQTAGVSQTTAHLRCIKTLIRSTNQSQEVITLAPLLFQILRQISLSSVNTRWRHWSRKLIRCNAPTSINNLY